MPDAIDAFERDSILDACDRYASIAVVKPEKFSLLINIVVPDVAAVVDSGSPGANTLVVTLDPGYVLHCQLRGAS